jgi:hypothetical protein
MGNSRRKTVDSGRLVITDKQLHRFFKSWGFLSSIMQGNFNQSGHNIIPLRLVFMHMPRLYNTGIHQRVTDLAETGYKKIICIADHLSKKTSLIRIGD